MASAAFLFIYFIWLPFRSGRAKKDLFHEDVKLNVAIADNQFTTDGIKTNGDILGQTFISFRKIWGKWFLGAVIISSLLLIWHIVDFNSRAGEWAVNRYRNVYSGSLSSALGNISETYFDFEKLSIGYFIQAALVAALLLFSGVLLEKLVSKTSFKFSQLIVHWLSIMVLVTVFFGILFLPWVIKIIVAPAVFGFLFIISFLIINEKLFLPNAIVEGWKIFFSNFGKIIALNIVLFILSLALITLVISQSTTVYSAFIRWNVSGNVNTIKHFYGLLYNFIALFAYVLVVSFWFVGNSLLYFSLKEILHATTLKKSIASLKPKRKIYGKEFDV